MEPPPTTYDNMGFTQPNQNDNNAALPSSGYPSPQQPPAYTTQPPPQQPLSCPSPVAQQAYPMPAAGYYPPMQPVIMYAPPQQQQQQQQQTVVINNNTGPQAIIVEAVPNYSAQRSLACVVLWCCNPLFGLVAWVLGMSAKATHQHSPDEAIRLGKASLGVSISGIIVTIIIIIIVVSVSTSSGSSGSSGSRSSSCTSYGRYGYC